MERRDPLTLSLFGMGCVLITVAPVLIVASACTAGSSSEPASPPHKVTAPRAPGSSTAAVHSDAQEGEGAPPSMAQPVI